MANRDFGALVRQWRELEASGIPLEPLENRVGLDVRSSGSGLTIRRGRDAARNEIRQLKGSVFAYIFSIFVRCDRPGKVIIWDSWIGTPWEDPCITLLEDPRAEGQHPGWYSFPCDTEEFAREEVINHRIHCVLPRGDIREGFLLAVGSTPPNKYRNNDKIPITFTLVDQWGCEHSARLHLSMTRFSARATAVSKSARGPLFSRPDIIAPRSSLVAPPRPTKIVAKEDADAIRRAFKEAMNLNCEGRHTSISRLAKSR
jgi:hypothetical protein